MAKKSPKKKKSNRAIPPGRTMPVPGRPDRDRRVRQHARIARVLKLLNLIQSRGRWNSKALSQELECSERTVYRDLEVLEFAGVPWNYDEADQCYRVRPDFRFPTLGLTDEETLGQAVATVLSTAPGLNAAGGAKPATRKLAASSAEKTHEVLADAMQLIEVFDLKLADHSGHHEAIKTAQFALLQGCKLTGTYESPYEKKSQRLVLHPYRLCLVKNAWYLVGHLDGETTPKTLRVARFQTLRMIDQPATVPANFCLREYLGNAWAVYRGDKSYSVKLRFTPEAAKVVTETRWHHTQRETRHRDGGVTLEFTVDGLNEILNWLLAWSGRVQVLAPEELKELYAKALKQAIDMNARQ